MEEQAEMGGALGKKGDLWQEQRRVAVCQMNRKMKECRWIKYSTKLDNTVVSLLLDCRGLSTQEQQWKQSSEERRSASGADAWIMTSSGLCPIRAHRLLSMVRKEDAHQCDLREPQAWKITSFGSFLFLWSLNFCIYVQMISFSQHNLTTSEKKEKAVVQQVLHLTTHLSAPLTLERTLLFEGNFKARLFDLNFSQLCIVWKKPEMWVSH